MTRLFRLVCLPSGTYNSLEVGIRYRSGVPSGDIELINLGRRGGTEHSKPMGRVGVDGEGGNGFDKVDQVVGRNHAPTLGAQVVVASRLFCGLK